MRTLGHILGAEPRVEHRRDRIALSQLRLRLLQRFGHRLYFRAMPRLKAGEKPSTACHSSCSRFTLWCHSQRRPGCAEVTYQGVMRVFRDNRALLATLAYADCRMILRPGAAIDWGVAGGRQERISYLAILKRLAVNARDQHATLAEILLECLPHGDTQRTIFLKSISRRLAGRVVPADRAATGRRSHWRTTLQWWALRHFSADGLAGAVERSPAGRAKQNVAAHDQVNA